MAKSRTWVSVALVTLGILAIFGVALVAGTILWIRQHVDTQYTSARQAEDEFARARARFAGQHPLIELRAGQPPVRDASDRPATGTAVKDLHVLAYDAREGKLIRATVPMWLVRIAPRNQVRVFSEEGFPARRGAHLDLDDIDRHGPGLVLDMIDSPLDGGRLLMWAE